jgi:membrane-associated phospholipid phosphatase
VTRAEPFDLAFMAYVAFSGLLVAGFGWRQSTGVWVGLTAAHLAILAAALWLSRQPRTYPSPGGFVRDIYPFLFIFFLYWELRYLALLFSDGYHDSVILRLEGMLFGEQLAMTLSHRLPYLWLSEIMHFFYGIYWVLLPLGALGLYFRKKIEGFRELVFVELVVFFGCYLVFIFFPVAGPHYQFPLIGGELAEGRMYRFVHWVLSDGGSKGAAFPSSHVAVAVAILLVCWRHDRTVWLAMLPLVIGLTIATVYGRFHYGVDALSGVLTAFVLVPLARYLRARLRLMQARMMGNAGDLLPV